MKQSSEGHVYCALTIAGSDSGGGAGIQADLKTFSAFEVYGMSVLAGLTAQNTLGVQGIELVPPAFVTKQLQSVFVDMPPDALKTGMLGNQQGIEAVANAVRDQGVSQVVVDPVMVAKGGEPLLEQAAVAAMCSELLPLALVVTPNIPEAEVLCGFAIDSLSACQKAARVIAAMGPTYVVIKGGHAESNWLEHQHNRAGSVTKWATDFIFANGIETYLAAPWVDSRKTHGTGCTFSAAVTACLAMGASPFTAIVSAKAYISRAITAAKTWDVGHGHGPTDHSVRGMVDTSLQPGGQYLWQGTRYEQMKR